MEGHKITDPDLGNKAYVEVKSESKKTTLVYPRVLFDERFTIYEECIRSGKLTCQKIALNVPSITVEPKGPEEFLSNLAWISFDFWFSDKVVLKTVQNRFDSLFRERPVLEIDYDEKFKCLAVYVLKARVTADTESEIKAIALLEFLIINWFERLLYVDGAGWNLLHFAAKYATPNIMRALLQLADKYYEVDEIKLFFESSTNFGNTGIKLANNRTDVHGPEIVSLLEKYFEK
jgi:hypothetical protein